MAAAESTGTAQALAFWIALTLNERRVGTAMAQGWTNAEIASRLGLSPKTVESRVSAIYEKLPDSPGAYRRVQTALLIKSVLEQMAPLAHIGLGR